MVPSRHPVWLTVTVGASALLVGGALGVLSAGASRARAASPVAPSRQAHAVKAASAGDPRVPRPRQAARVGSAHSPRSLHAAVLRSHAVPTEVDTRSAVAARGDVASARAPRVQDAYASGRPTVSAWLSPLRRCSMYRYRHFCDGPRRVPRPTGQAAARASLLELGTHKAAAKLLRSEPRPEWRAALADLGIPKPAQLLWPVQGGHFGRGYGLVPDGLGGMRLHRGVDVGADTGDLVHSVADGLVAYADNGVRGYGNLLIVLLGDGSVAAYAHCRSIYVFPGQVVRRGQVVAEVGDTGLSLGAHLHFELHVHGRAVDPEHRFGRWWR